MLSAQHSAAAPRNSENRADSIRTNGRLAAAVRASAVEDGGSDSDRLHRLFRASGGMADALASGASVLRDVGVQVPLRPQRAVLQTQRHKVTNSKEGVTFAFGVVGGLFVMGLLSWGFEGANPPKCFVEASRSAASSTDNHVTCGVSCDGIHFTSPHPGRQLRAQRTASRPATHGGSAGSYPMCLER
jgi:hypothetical protein